MLGIIVVRESNGTGGFNALNIDDVTNRLNSAFNDKKIYFSSLGHDFINNSNYYNIDDPEGVYTEYNELVQINNNPNAINIYLVNDAVGYDGAARYKNNYAVIVNSSANSTTTPHEVGHCFDLLHTHENGNEEIDGSNCSWAGDKVCDTPADPGLLQYNNNGILSYVVDISCNYTGGNGYNPDTGNIMSYSRKYCRDHFTSGQNTRMRQAFASSSILQNVISNGCAIPKLTGSNLVCTSNTTFNLLNGGNSVTWQVSSNLQIISSNNNEIVVKATGSNINGNGFIKAILPFETLQNDIWVGKPNINDYTLVWSGPSCINYNWSTISFGVQKNSSNSCSLQGLPEKISEVEWNIIPSQPINITLNSGNYNCLTSRIKLVAVI